MDPVGAGGAVGGGESSYLLPIKAVGAYLAKSKAESDKTKLVARIFSTWQKHTRKTIEERKRLGFVLYFKNNAFMQKVFSAWKADSKENCLLRVRLYRFFMKKELSLLKNSFKNWRKFKTEEREKIVRVVRHQHRKNRMLAKKCFSHWRQLNVLKDRSSFSSAVGATIERSKEGKPYVESTFSRAFSQVYSLKSFDKGLVFLRIAAWIATIALGCIPLITLYASCKVLDCVRKES